MRYRSSTLLMSLAVWLSAVPWVSCAVDHTPWDTLLRHDVEQGRVDYEGLKSERDTLDRYVASLAQANPASWSRQDQLAFWINAYNAVVVQAVLDRYPLKSVRQIKGFFDGLRYRIAGRDLTLNEIEAESRALGDWRIHFAVVCASRSCPPLRSEAYVGDRLDVQLAEQTRNFLRDSQQGLRVDAGTLWVSKIFDWYATDFIPTNELGALRRPTAEKLGQVLQPYLSTETMRAIEGRKLGLKFFPYDWSLNAT